MLGSAHVGHGGVKPVGYTTGGLQFDRGRGRDAINLGPSEVSFPGILRFDEGVALAPPRGAP